MLWHDQLDVHVRPAPHRLERLQTPPVGVELEFDHPSRTAARMHAALDLLAAGCQAMRERLRRDMPSATPADVEARVLAWLHAHEGAELGDGDGVPASPERMKRLGLG